MNGDIAGKIITASVSSANAPDIMLHQPYKPKPYRVHGQLHCMLLTPAGGGKSSILDAIPENMKFEGEKYTGPGILGTIKKDGEYVPGAVYHARGKCLIIDEFHSLHRDALRGLLKLTEQQKYRSTIAWNVQRDVRVNKRDFKALVKGNTMQIKYARFSCIVAGIYARNRTVDDDAFLSRFMPIRFDFDINEAAKLSLGKQYMMIKPEPVIYTKDPVHFEDYERFVRIYLGIVKSLPKKLYENYVQKPAFFRRNLLHFARIFAFDSGGGSIDDWEKYIPYMSIIPYNCIASTLTLTEYEIYSMIVKKMSQVKVAAELGVSQPYISKVDNKLKGLGLV